MQLIIVGQIALSLIVGQIVALSLIVGQLVALSLIVGQLVALSLIVGQIVALSLTIIIVIGPTLIEYQRTNTKSYHPPVSAIVILLFCNYHVGPYNL